MKLLRILLRVSHPPVLATVLLFLAMGSLQGRYQAMAVAIAITAISCNFIGAAAFNHLLDAPIDRINGQWMPNRPLVSGAGSPRLLLVIAVVSSVMSVVVGMTLSLASGLILAAGVVLAFSYSAPKIRLCSRGAITTALLPIFYVALPFLLGMQSSGAAFSRTSVLLLVGSYLIFAGRILLKDFRDVQGDALYGKRTFLLRHGRRMTCWTSAWLWSTGTVVLMLTIGQLTALVLFALLLLAVFSLLKLAKSADTLRDLEIIEVLGKIGSSVLLVLITPLTVAPQQQPIAQALVMAFVLSYVLPAFGQLTMPKKSVQAIQTA